MDANPKKKPILLFGGTFNPPHFAHLLMVYALALQAKATMDYDFSAIEFILSMPWQKKNVLAAEHRQQMLALALADWQKKNHAVHINVQEVEHFQSTGTPSYSIHTLIERHTFYQKYFTTDADADAMKKSSPVELIYIIGQDQYNNLHTWHRWQELFDYATLWVVSRGGCAVQTNLNIPPELAKQVKFWQTDLLYRNLIKPDEWLKIIDIWPELMVFSEASPMNNPIKIEIKQQEEWLNGLMHISSLAIRSAFGSKNNSENLNMIENVEKYIPKKVLKYIDDFGLYLSEN